MDGESSYEDDDKRNDDNNKGNNKNTKENDNNKTRSIKISSLPSSSSLTSPHSFEEDLDGNNNNNYTFDDKRLISIDVISVDKQSRITLTKRAKKIIPLEPGDKITIYQDRYNKNIILKVQRQQPQPRQQQQSHQDTQQQVQENKIENWILTLKKDDGNEDSFSNKKNYGHRSAFNNKNKNNNNKSNIIDKAKDHLDTNKNQTQSSSPSSLTSSSSDNIHTSFFAHHNQDTLYSIPILLVEDEPDLLYAFGLFLKDEGYRNVKTFSNSKDVLKYLLGLKSSAHYNLVITDIRMPDINGIQLCQILKIFNPSIKLIIITALDSVKELASMFSEVTDRDIIRKPINQKQFIETVNNKVSTLLLP